MRTALNKYLLALSSTHTQIVSAVGGIFMLLSFSPYVDGLEWLFAIMALASWCYICTKNLSYINLFTFFTLKWVAVFWIWQPFHHLLQLGLSQSILLTSILIIFASTTQSLIHYFAVKITYSLNYEIKLYLVLPIVWLISDIFITYFYHVPWLSILTTQISAPYTIALSILAPIYSVPFIVIFSASILETLSGKPNAFFLCVGFTIIVSSVRYFSTDKPVSPIQVTIVQENVDKIQQNNDMMSSNTPRREAIRIDNLNLDKYYKTTLLAPISDIVIWPETAIGNSYTSLSERHLNRIVRLKDRHKNIIFGSQIHDDKIHNVSVKMSDDIDIIEKSHYVPFAEEAYPVWLARLAEAQGIPVSPFSYNSPSRNMFSLKIKNHIFNALPLICYDAAYKLYELRSDDTDFYIIHSENTWFTSLWATKQQLDIAKAIKVTSNKPVIYAVNSGCSAVLQTGQQDKIANNYKTEHLLSAIVYSTYR